MVDMIAASGAARTKPANTGGTTASIVAGVCVVGGGQLGHEHTAHDSDPDDAGVQQGDVDSDQEAGALEGLRVTAQQENA